MATREYKQPTYAAPFVKAKTNRVTYFGNPMIDNMMTALVAVTAEVWSTRRRMKVLESLLEAKGVTSEMVEAFLPSEKQTAEWAADRMTLHPIKTFTQGVKLPSFWQQSWKAAVIYCPQAANPGEAHQRRCAEKLGASWHVIDTGHYPMLTTPDELARIIISG